MRVGDIVKPLDGHDPLHCGSSCYEEAVVMSVDPFVMVSRSSDMKWSCELPTNYQVIGTASKSQIKTCMVRM